MQHTDAAFSKLETHASVLWTNDFGDQQTQKIYREWKKNVFNRENNPRLYTSYVSNSV